MTEQIVEEPPSIFNRISLHDVKDDDEIINIEIGCPADISLRTDDISNANDVKSIPDLDIPNSDIHASAQMIGCKLSPGLRRSHSDAADGSAMGMDEVQLPDRPESSISDKHRLSFASALKTASPVLKRRQTAIDNAIQNLLQEGKEFIHRKRQQVPLLAAHFNKTDLTPTMTAGSVANIDAVISSSIGLGRTGSIVYNRKDDTITLENDPASDIPVMDHLELAATGLDDLPDTINQNQPPPRPPRPVTRPSASKLASDPNPLPDANHPNEEPPDSRRASYNDPFQPKDTAPTSSPVTSSAYKSPVWWPYYKQIIGVLLLAITIAELMLGWRPIPAFILGVLWGSYVAYLVALVVFWFCLPPERYPKFGVASDTLPAQERQLTAQMSEDELLTEDTIIYKGWMNRLRAKYDPHQYHSNNTESVLVRLDRNLLRLSTPKTNLTRHAYCRETRVSPPTFISQEMFDMTGATVVLRPKNLAFRRWWSRKYPICIIFAGKLSGERRSSSPMSVTSQLQGMFGENVATDTAAIKAGSAKQDQAGEVAVDALVDDTLETEDVDADDETEDDSGPGLQATVSLPSNLDSMGQTEPIPRKKPSRKLRKKRRVIHLFARSQREKEQWFYRLRQAACHYTYADRRERFYRSRTNGRPYSTSDAMDSTSATGTAATTDQFEFMKVDDPLATEWILYISMQKQYERHMRSYMTKNRPKSEVQGMDLISMAWKTWMVTAPDASATGVSVESQAETPSKPGLAFSTISIDWANALGSRVFYDFSKNPQWMGTVQDRIQRKLLTLRLPYFIETLRLTHLEAGMTAPTITAVNEPSMNEWGLWIDAKLEYTGGLRLVLETKVNLMKLKHEAVPRGDAPIAGEKCSNYENEELPESPESSPDEDAPSVVSNIGPFHHHQHSVASKPLGQETPPRASAGKKFLNFVNKVAHSKHFQAATENKYVKKLMQGVSDTPLILEVEVDYLCGPLVVNIPPPPSNRLWWGFRFPPKVILKARPRVGDLLVNLSHITDWIENKLVLLLEKNLVVPNMDDLRVPMLGGSPICKNYNK